MNLKDVGCDGVKTGPIKFHCSHLVNMAVDLPVPQKAGLFLHQLNF